MTFLPYRDLVAEAVERARAEQVEAMRRHRAAEEARLRPPAGHPCVVCGGELAPTVHHEPATVFGQPSRSWHSGYVCASCHLVYGVEAAVGERP